MCGLAWREERQEWKNGERERRRRREEEEKEKITGMDGGTNEVEEGKKGESDTKKRRKKERRKGKGEKIRDGNITLRYHLHQPRPQASITSLYLSSFSLPARQSPPHFPSNDVEEGSKVYIR